MSGELESTSASTALVKLPVMTAVEGVTGRVKRKSAIVVRLSFPAKSVTYQPKRFPAEELPGTVPVRTMPITSPYSFNSGDPIASSRIGKEMFSRSPAFGYAFVPVILRPLPRVPKYLPRYYLASCSRRRAVVHCVERALLGAGETAPIRRY